MIGGCGKSGRIMVAVCAILLDKVTTKIFHNLKNNKRMTCNKCGNDIPEDSIFCPNCGTSMQNATINNMQRKPFSLSLKAILLAFAVGIWVLVLQNLGILTATQDVKVQNSIDVSGTVDVGNSVDVNLQYINGRRDVFFNNPSRGDKDKYYLIPVTVE